ncbi:hypothetical protein SCUCBS95973_008876 [Sporothrix curviconia]|uniref:Dienelactone hydrolase domain-containing protein n=1 Tax=Sporothrix curviconia TaxID=1260050 RepID=A0ABP0CQ61_9PEZI
MADADLATRAPESDAAEDSNASPAAGASGAATASSGAAGADSADSADSAAGAPKLCDDCVTDRPTPHGRTPVGEVCKLGDVDVYISKPSDYPHVSARLLLLLTGGTGMPSTNNQIQADMYAEEGFVVVMPDLFGGDVAPNAAAVAEAQEQQGQQGSSSSGSSFLDLFKIKAAETVKSFMIDMWLARHTEAKVLPLLHRVLDAARDEFADAVSSGGGVYAVGYCFGGRYVLLLAGDKGKAASGAAPAAGTSGHGGSTETDADADPNADVDTVMLETGPVIKAGVLAHATLVSRDDFQGLQAPISMVCVENDPMFPDEVRTAGEDYLSEHNVEHEVQVYPGVPHGFAVFGDYADESIKLAQATAFGQMLKWLKDH